METTIKYAAQITGSVIDAAIFTYYCVSVLGPRWGKKKTFLVMFAIMGVMQGIVLPVFAEYPVMRQIIGMPTIILSLVFLFKEAYWKRFVLFISYFAIAVVPEQVIYYITYAIAGFYPDTSFVGIDPKDYPSMAVAVAALLLSEFLIVKFIAIPLWNKRFHALKGISAASVILLTLTVGMGIALVTTVAYQYTGDDLNYLLILGNVAFISFSIAFLAVTIRNSAKQARRELEGEFVREQLAMQTAHREEMTEQYDRLRKLRHDFKNHMQIITGLFDREKHDELREYLSALTDELVKAEGIGFCSDPAVDAVLTYKREAMLAHDIHVDYRIMLPPESSIPAFDICSVLFNLLDNALAACLAVESGRFVDLEIKASMGNLVITMKNSCRLLSGGVPARVGESHGLGTKIINEIARKNNGQSLFESQGSDTYLSVVSLKL